MVNTLLAIGLFLSFIFVTFLRATAVPAGILLRRILAMGILSVRPSVCLSRAGGIPSPGEIETPGLHHMIA